MGRSRGSSFWGRGVPATPRRRWLVGFWWRSAAVVVLVLATTGIVIAEAPWARASGPTLMSISPSSGPVRGGTRVTLKGSGFLGPGNRCAANESAYFGADPQDDYWIPANAVQVVSDSTMVVTTPQDYGGCPNFQAPKIPAVSASVNVAEPYALSSVKATIAPLPNSARGGDGSNPVPSAPAARALTLPVINGTVAIPLSNVGDGGAFSITIAPG